MSSIQDTVLGRHCLIKPCTSLLDEGSEGSSRGSWSLLRGACCDRSHVMGNLAPRFTEPSLIQRHPGFLSSKQSSCAVLIRDLLLNLRCPTNQEINGCVYFPEKVWRVEPEVLEPIRLAILTRRCTHFLAESHSGMWTSCLSVKMISRSNAILACGAAFDS